MKKGSQGSKKGRKPRKQSKGRMKKGSQGSKKERKPRKQKIGRAHV